MKPSKPTVSYGLSDSTVQQITNIFVVAVIVLTIIFGVNWSNARNFVKETFAHKDTVKPSEKAIQSTSHAGKYPGMQTYILLPGAEPVRFALRGGNIDWHSESQEYWVRYIKRDGMPWRPNTASPEGWIKAVNAYTPQYVLSEAGPIKEVHFMVKTSERIKTSKSEKKYSAIELHVTTNPTF